MLEDVCISRLTLFMHQYSSKKDWFIHKGAAHHFSYFGSQKNLVISHLPITKALRVHWEKKNIQHLISVRNWSFLLITAVYVTLASTYSTSNCNKGKMHHFPFTSMKCLMHRDLQHPGGTHVSHGSLLVEEHRTWGTQLNYSRHYQI